MSDTRENLPSPNATRNAATTAYLKRMLAADGLRTLGWLAGGVLASGAVGAAALIVAACAADSSNSPLTVSQMFEAMLVGLGAALGGGITLGGNIGESSFGAAEIGSVTVVPLGTLALLIPVTFWIARHRLRHDRVLAPNHVAEVVRAGVEAAVVALAITFATAFARFDGPSLSSGTVLHVQSTPLFFTLLITLSLSLFVARASLRSVHSAENDGAWLRGLREGGLATIAQFGTFGLVAVLVLAMVSVHMESLIPMFAGLPVLGNVAAMLAALGHSGSVSMVAGSYPTVNVNAFSVPDGLGVWTVLIAVLSLVVTAGMVGVRRTREQAIVWGRIWQAPLAILCLWCVIVVAAGISFRGGMLSLAGFGAGGFVRLSWWSPIAVGIGALLMSIAAEFVPALAYRLNPRLLTLFGGKRNAGAWLAGASRTDAPTAVEPSAVVPRRPSERAPEARDAVGGDRLTATVDGVNAVSDGRGTDESGQISTELPPLQPLSASKRRALILTGSIAGIVVLLSVGTTVTISVLNQQRDPVQAVGQYVELLSDGKAEQATQLVDPGLQNADRELLTDEVLATAEVRIEIVDAETVERSEDGATVSATLALDGERFEKSFRLTPGPKELLVLDTWILDDSLVAPVRLSAEGATSLAIGDTSIELEDDGMYGEAERLLYAYPGVYPVAAPESDFLKSSREQLRVTPDGTREASATVTMTPTEAFETAVLEQVKNRLTQCVTIPTNMDDVCPYVTKDDDLAEMRVVAQPSGLESISIDRFSSLDGTIATRANSSTFNKDPELKETTVSVWGEVDIEDGKPVIAELHVSNGW